MVAAPLLDSSSGWACTASSRSWSGCWSDKVTRALSLAPGTGRRVPDSRRPETPCSGSPAGGKVVMVTAPSGTVSHSTGRDRAVHPPGSRCYVGPIDLQAVPFGGRPPEFQEYLRVHPH